MPRCAIAKDASRFSRKLVSPIEVLGKPVVPRACEVDSPIVIIKVVVIVGPLPTVGVAGGNTRLIRIVTASAATNRIAVRVGRRTTAAQEFLYVSPSSSDWILCALARHSSGVSGRLENESIAIEMRLGG
jgi:hypothetical protein